ncbi:transcriptional regulator [Terriglobus albidus]|uniref:transcriptional regulator n=1 Tax=Terriglobus albidus TaxID=1592106 RepID=UPI0037D9F188
MHCIYFFGEFTFETGPNSLNRGTQKVPLPAKQLDVLRVLIQAQGQPVRKDRLLREVWPNIHVENHTLIQTIYLLRLSLGKMADGQDYIQTVSGYGYRLAAHITTSEVDATQVSPRHGIRESLTHLWHRLSLFF